MHRRASCGLELGSWHCCCRPQHPRWAAHLPWPWAPPAAGTSTVMPADLRGSIMPYLPDACMGFPSALLLPWSLVATSLPSQTPAPGSLCGFMCPPSSGFPPQSLDNPWGSPYAGCGPHPRAGLCAISGRAGGSLPSLRKLGQTWAAWRDGSFVVQVDHILSPLLSRKCRWAGRAR